VPPLPVDAWSRFTSALEHVDRCTRVNLVGTQNVLLAARRAGVAKLLYSGSSTYYGNNPVPQQEDQARDPINVYGLTKATGEDYVRHFDRAFELPSLTLRYFNVYGPGQPTSGAYALVLGIFLDRAARGLPLEIHGDGSQRRDFVHVKDVVEASLLAWRSPQRGRTYNVGSGTSLSSRELADLISPLQCRRPARQGDSMGTRADLTRIRAELGWEPRVSFADGLADLRSGFRPSGL
jgi:UDP-glucose 4-epimerase